MIYYTVSQVAAMLGVSTWTVHRREEAGKLPPCRRVGIRHERQWAKDEMDAFIASGSEYDDRFRPAPAVDAAG